MNKSLSLILFPISNVPVHSRAFFSLSFRQMVWCKSAQIFFLYPTTPMTLLEVGKESEILISGEHFDCYFEVVQYKGFLLFEKPLHP